jgi:hypothetical protein
VEVVSVPSLSVFLELSCLGSAPNSVPGASPAQLPYAARADSSAVRLRFSLRTSLLAGIVRFGALSNRRAKSYEAVLILIHLRYVTVAEATHRDAERYRHKQEAQRHKKIRPLGLTACVEKQNPKL